MVLGTWYLVFGTWYLVLGTWYMVQECIVHGALQITGYLPSSIQKALRGTSLRYVSTFKISGSEAAGQGFAVVSHRSLCCRGTRMSNKITRFQREIKTERRSFNGRKYGSAGAELAEMLKKLPVFLYRYPIMDAFTEWNAL